MAADSGHRRPRRENDLDQNHQCSFRQNAASSGRAHAVTHISDEVLDCSRACLRLASECSDDHIATELQLLSLRLLLAAVGDAELTVDGLPVLSLSA
jgi:hypothetical protein